MPQCTSHLAHRLHQAMTVSRGRGEALDPTDAQALFTKSMNYDLDTPTALLAMNALAGEIIAGAEIGRDVETAQAALRDMCQVFGLSLGVSQEERIRTGWNKHLERFKVVEDELTKEPIYG